MNIFCMIYIWLRSRYKEMSKGSLLLYSQIDDNSGSFEELGQKYWPVNFLNTHASQFVASVTQSFTLPTDG